MSCTCQATTEPTTKLDALMPFVVSQISQIPYEYGIMLLRQAYLEFARRTSLLTVEFPITLQKDVYDYYLEVPEGHHLHKLVGVGYCGTEVVIPSGPNYWFCCGYGFYFHGDRVVFSQKPSQDGTNPVRVRGILLPTDCVMEIPSRISVPYGKYIADKALAEAFSIPNKPWSDKIESAKRNREFAIGVQQGKAQAWTGGIPSNSRLRPVRWV